MRVGRVDTDAYARHRADPVPVRAAATGHRRSGQALRPHQRTWSRWRWPTPTGWCDLLGNAVKFSVRGGVVSVTASRQDHDALFSVRDGGRGIPADRLESIFERFRQVDASDAREKGGSGLGLPIARGIVERHGGRMWAQSGEGEGATFRFTLPLAHEPGERTVPDVDLSGWRRGQPAGSAT